MVNEVFVAGFARTPIASFNGSFADTPAAELGGMAIKQALERGGMPGGQVDEVIMGNVLSAGLGQNPARQAAILAGLPPAVSAATVNKVCGSGLQAVVLATRAIRSGDCHVIVAGGMENMTRAPYLLTRARNGYRLGNGELIDSLQNDGLCDAYERVSMGIYGEACASEQGFSRMEQDDYAIESNIRALAAIHSGAFITEIVPVTTKMGKEIIEISQDEQPRRFDEQKLRSLRPVFVDDGTVTAGNSSSLNDAAAAIVVVSKAACEHNGVRPIARILGTSSVGIEPKWFTLAPIEAIRSLLSNLNMTVGDVDLFEINEAFAVVALAAMKGLAIPRSKLNVNGGAVALGHPIGASGARILVSLINSLMLRQQKIGIAAICIGGGESVSVAIERI